MISLLGRCALPILESVLEEKPKHEIAKLSSGLAIAAVNTNSSTLDCAVMKADFLLPVIT